MLIGIMGVLREYFSAYISELPNDCEIDLVIDMTILRLTCDCLKVFFKVSLHTGRR